MTKFVAYIFGSQVSDDNKNGDATSSSDNTQSMTNFVNILLMGVVVVGFLSIICYSW